MYSNIDINISWKKNKGKKHLLLNQMSEILSEKGDCCFLYFLHVWI